MKKDNSETAHQTNNASRPFFLSIVIVAIAVYTMVLSIAFLLALIFNEWIVQTLNDFFEDKNLPVRSIFWLAITGLFLNLLSFYAIIRLWKLKKWAFYLYICSSLFFVIFPFILGFGNIYSVFIILTTIGLTGIFIKDMH